MKKTVILTVATVLMIGVLFAGAASADSTVVNTEQELKNALAAGGEIILGADIVISERCKITNTVTLDLAGHTLSANEKDIVFLIKSSGDLTLKDSSPEAKGKITKGLSYLPYYGSGVTIDGGKFTMDGGTIEDCNSYPSNKGMSAGGVYIGTDGIFIMNGGTIVNCESKYAGGGVTIENGYFEMNGGSIRKCKSGEYGGGVHIDMQSAKYKAKFTMNGGSIEDCTASFSGGGVFICKGIFEMNGGEIKNCKTEKTLHVNEGGGVYLEGGKITCTFIMNGGTISFCYAYDYGGGVFVDDAATFNLNGGMITECWVDDNDGGGVYVDEDATFRISGDPIVINNKAGSSTDNVYLDDDEDLELSGPFIGCIGISNQDGKFGANKGHSGASYFFKDGSSERAKNSGGDLKFGEPIPEFKDITAETNGLVKATNPLTDTRDSYTVGTGQTIRMMTPIVIGGGVANDPVSIQIDGTLLGMKRCSVITVDNGKYLELIGNGRLSDGRSLGFNGGGVNLREDSCLTLDGVTVSDNAAGKNGGGICGDKGTSIVIRSGKIENNKAGENGGGIYSRGLLILMDGGEIKGNTAGKNGGGIYASENPVFAIRNTATVTENKKGEVTDNVYLESNQRLNLIGYLTGQIGISYAGGIPSAENQFGVVPVVSAGGAENIRADGSDLSGKRSDDNTLVWSPPKTEITVMFNADGGSVSPSEKVVYVGEPYGFLPTPVRDRYIFQGWFTEPDGAGKNIGSNTIVPSGLGSSQTLYAKWRGPIVKVTFDATGGSVSPASKLVIKGEMYGELPIPESADPAYRFDGWYLDSEYTSGNEVTKSTKVEIGSDHPLYAKWVMDSVTVSFDSNGIPTEGGSPSSISVYPGRPYGELPIPEPTDDDYTFVGWYLNSACTGAKITQDTIVKTFTDHTLYAKWFGPIIVTNTNIDFGTVFKDDPIPSLTDVVYTELADSVTLSFPGLDSGFIFKQGEEGLNGKIITLQKAVEYKFTITPSSTATEGFYSADIPITKGDTPLGELSVTMSVVAKNLKNDGKSSVPILPIVYNLIDAKNSSRVAWLVGVEGESNLDVDGEGTATISLASTNAADIPELQITNVVPKPDYAPTAIMLSDDSQITAQYPSSKQLMNKYRNPAGTYSVELGLTDVSRNLPTFSGTFNESLARPITAMEYTPVAMVSPVDGTDALYMMNLLIKDKGVEVTFTVPVSQLPESISLTGAVSVFSVDADGNVFTITPDSAKEVGDDYVVTAHASSLSSYVLAFDNGWEYYGITPLEVPHGVIYPDYLYAQPGDVVSVTPVPEEGYVYRGLIIYNETSLIDVITSATFSMPAEHVYLYGIFTTGTEPICIVTFNMNGHGSQVLPQFISSGAKVSRPEPEPSEIGYTFEGWFSDSALTTPYDFMMPVTEDIILHAKWTEASGHGHSPSIPSDYTPSSYVEPMEQETAEPTTTPTLVAPTMMPTTKPTATTSKSPAPLAGLIAGLGIAGLVLRLRK